MKQRVLILQHEISRYNSPVFDLIARQVDLTVGWFLRDNSPADATYSKVQLSWSTMGRFFRVKGLRQLCADYDVVVFDPNPKCPDYYLTPFRCKRTYKAIPWTIGVRASYKRRYVLPFPKKGLYYHMMDRMFRRSDAIVFYMPQPIDHWVTQQLPRQKFFAAHNTVQVDPSPIDWQQPRTSILFVGSLYKEKMADELIRAYLRATEQAAGNYPLPTLDIVGDGDQLAALRTMAEESTQSRLIRFHGAIFDEQQLRQLFSKSLICVSPDQAGLSVLKSMGYGVPFVTHADAITGGERLNITHGQNSFLYESEQQLADIILQAISQPETVLQMGRNAHHYYTSCATPAHMAQGFIDAINYATNQKP